MLPHCVFRVVGAQTDGTTPLHIACQSGHISVVKALVALGAAVNQLDVSPLYVLGHAVLTRCAHDPACKLAHMFPLRSSHSISLTGAQGAP